MITPFWGELFQYPIPLELSHNYCSNKCAYCFANLNTPDRTADVGRVANQFKNYHKKKDIASLMLQNKLSVCVSNKTDPFAASNYQVAIPNIMTLHSLDIPVAYHTRGGKHFEKFYSLFKVPKTLFYISICHTDDEVRKLIEPGATEVSTRWQMAKQLIKDGHEVVIGLNPFVKQWIDTDIFIKNCIDAGVKNVIVQPLHINASQISNMSGKEVINIGEDVMNLAKKRSSYDNEDVRTLVRQLINIGINAYDTQNFNETDIISAWHRGLQGKTFKTYYDFYIWCRKNKKDNDPIFFDDFYNFIAPDVYKNDTELPIYPYLTSVDRRYRQTKKSGKEIALRLTFKDLCLKIWNDNTSIKSITSSNKFAFVGEILDNIMYLETDEDNNLVYSFNNNNFEFLIINQLNVN